MSASILTITLNPAVDIAAEADLVRPIHKIRTSAQIYDPGGGGINVARVVARLGGDVEALHLSGGETGDVLSALLDAQNLTHRRIPAKGATRIAFNVYERDTGFEYRFVPDSAATSSDEIAACFDAVSAAKGDYLVASGSLPKGAPEDTYERLGEIAKANGMRYVLDTSGPCLKRTLSAVPVFLVKPSLRELQEISGRELDEASARFAAREIVDAGLCEMVAVTLGRQGAILAHRDGLLRLPATHVKTLSAVGAGDSFLAAMVWAFSESWSVEDAFRIGVAAGAAAALTPGTELCRKDDVYRLFTDTRF